MVVKRRLGESARSVVVVVVVEVIVVIEVVVEAVAVVVAVVGIAVVMLFGTFFADSLIVNCGWSSGTFLASAFDQTRRPFKKKEV